jgi:hypothetical protein
MSELLVSAYQSKRALSPHRQLAFGTILHAPWDTSIEEPEIDVYRIQAETRAALSAMFPSWLAVIEPQAFSNVRHESGGNLLSVHCHFIGHGVSSMQAVESRRQTVSRRFKGRFEDVETVKIQRIGPTELDLARTVSYLLKAPRRSKTLYVHRISGRGNLHESEANDRFIRYLRMVQILSSMRIDRIVYAANEGAGIRADALREARSWLRTGEGTRKPPVHSDAIEKYWLELWRRLDQSRYKLPVVKIKRL